TDTEALATAASGARSVLLIPLEPEIFAVTLRHNLTIDDEYSSEELETFSDRPRLGNVLERLKHNWETNLASKGLNLSVGEKQRVALARGLLRARSRQMILLDEPTSSLDPATEKEVFMRLLKHFSDRTVLTACHRLK